MRVAKEREFLVFYLDDGKTCKYNLSNGETIGKKGGVVKSLHSQLTNYTMGEIFDSIEDEKYAKFLKIIRSNFCNYYCTNFGTVLKKAKEESWLESYVVAGFKDFDYSINIPLSKIPKWLVRYCRGEFDMEHRLTPGLLNYYNKDSSLFQSIFKFVSEQDYEFNWIAVYSNYDRIYELIKIYGYDYKALLNYINNLMKYEGETRFYNVTSLIQDEVQMRKTMATKIVNGETIVGKFDKYWKCIRTTHNITIKNYNRFREEYDEMAFSNLYNKDLEYSDGEYCIIYPKTTHDLKDEAQQQSNCVASYISRVIERRCDIVLMRKVDKPDKSLVTVEIVSGRIVQRLGRYNCEPTKEELEFLGKYSKKVLTKLK